MAKQEHNIIPRARNSVRKWMKEQSLPYKELISYYTCAMMEVETRFRVLDEDFSIKYDRNPIETIKTRIKSFDSIMDKLSRNSYPLTVESIENNLNDVAGVRVICSFQSDVYQLAEAFLSQDGVQLLVRKDYISNPKPSGYRSLHLVVAVPIFLHDHKKLMKVEVQFRTLAMDWWASVEHTIRYKKDVELSEQAAKELFECAEMSDALDRRMEYINSLAQKK